MYAPLVSLHRVPGRRPHRDKYKRERLLAANCGVRERRLDGYHGSVKTATERAADLMSDLAGHRYGWPIGGLLWLLAHRHWPSVVEGISFLFLFVQANTAAREVKSLHVKVDSLV